MSTKPSFLSAKKLDDGQFPKVAINNKNTVVEVHETEKSLSAGLWHHVGSVQTSNISWSNSKKYDSGVDPSVAINENYAIEVHKSQWNSGLWYHYGTVDNNNKTISWSGSISMSDRGYNPDVAMTKSGHIVEIHMDGGSGTKLWYRTGKMLNNGVSWNGTLPMNDIGRNPSVAINDNGYVIEAHSGGSSGYEDKIFYRVGKLNFNTNTIEWGITKYYDSGYNFSVALTENNKIFEAHIGAGSYWNKIFYNMGEIVVGANGTLSVNWQPNPTYFTNGNNVHIAYGGSTVVMVFDYFYPPGRIGHTQLGYSLLHYQNQ